MANYRYYLGPLVKTAFAGSVAWAAPAGTVGMVDLAALPDQAISPNSTDARRVGFFASNAVLPSEYALLGQGDCRDLAVTAAMQSAWRSMTGYRPQGDRLID